MGEPGRVLGLGGRFPAAVSHGMDEAAVWMRVCCRSFWYMIYRLRIFDVPWMPSHDTQGQIFAFFSFFTRGSKTNAAPWCGAFSRPS